MQNIKNCDDLLLKTNKFHSLCKKNEIKLTDRVYLERLISNFLGNDNFLSFEGVVCLKRLQKPFELTSPNGVKKILERLFQNNSLSVFEKVGKYHKHEYMISINLEYTKLYI